MPFSFTSILKGLSIKQEDTVAPTQIIITPGGTPDTTTTIVSSQTQDRTLTLPDGDGELMTSGSAPLATPTQNGFVSTVAQSFGGVKTFVDGLISEEDILVDSTVNPYALVGSKTVVTGDSKSIAFASGETSGSGNSGDAVLISGDAPQTAPDPLVIQGVTFTQLVGFYGVGKITETISVQIIIDDVNITNPAAPAFNLRGSASQRLVIRVNSATTVDDLVAAFLLAGAPVTSAYTAVGSGATTFVNDLQTFTGAYDHGVAKVQSDYHVRLGTRDVVLGQEGSNTSQVGIRSSLVSGVGDSDTIFILSGLVQGSGNSGGISMRSSDMVGSGASGGLFLRTGTINGSLNSGNNTISTGTTNSFATANSGRLIMTTGTVNGISGNSGRFDWNTGNNNSSNGGSGIVNLSSGTTIDGNSGAMNLFTGVPSGSGTRGDVNITGNIILLTPSASASVSVNGNVHINAGNGLGFYNTANTFNTSLQAQPGATSSLDLYLPQADGTAGQVLSTDGAGVLSFISAGGGGANTSLSNLVSPTAINEDLIFTVSPEVPLQTPSTTVHRIKTADTVAPLSTNSSHNLEISTGSSSQGSTGYIKIKTPQATNTGWPTGAIVSGNIEIDVGISGSDPLITPGKFKIKDQSNGGGTTGTIGHVLTQVAADGTTQWQAPTGGSGFTTSLKTVNYTAVNGDEIFADTAAFGPFTVTLPITPSIGHRVKIADYNGNWAAGNLTVGRNGENIMGLASDYTLNVDDSWAEFVYVDATQGWRALL